MASGTHNPLVRRFPALRPARLASATLALALLASLAAQPVRADTEAQLKAAEKQLNALISQISSEQKTVNDYQQQADALAVQIDHIQSDIARTQANIRAAAVVMVCLLALGSCSRHRP